MLSGRIRRIIRMIEMAMGLGEGEEMEGDLKDSDKLKLALFLSLSELFIASIFYSFLVGLSDFLTIFFAFFLIDLPLFIVFIMGSLVIKREEKRLLSALMVSISIAYTLLIAVYLISSNTAPSGLMGYTAYNYLVGIFALVFLIDMPFLVFLVLAFHFLKQEKTLKTMYYLSFALISMQLIIVILLVL